MALRAHVGNAREPAADHCPGDRLLRLPGVRLRGPRARIEVGQR